MSRARRGPSGRSVEGSQHAVRRGVLEISRRDVRGVETGNGVDPPSTRRTSDPIAMKMGRRLDLGPNSKVDVLKVRLSMRKSVKLLTKMRAYAPSRAMRISGSRRRSDFRFFALERGRREKHFGHGGAREKNFQKVGWVWSVDFELCRRSPMWI